MSEDDDREMRQKSKDNDRFARNKKTPAPLHSKNANKRMNTGASGAKRGDEDVDLDGYDPAFPDDADAVSKQDEDDDPALPANNDVDDIARELLQLEDEDKARAFARIIVRIGDDLGEVRAALEDDRARGNPRMETV
jgi:hypothetical protein